MTQYLSDQERKNRDEYFNRQMKRLNDIGRFSHDPERKTAKRDKYIEEAKKIQKDLARLTAEKQKDNQVRGRKYGDGREY